MPPPPRRGIKRWCVSDVCLTSVWRRLTSVAYIGPKSRTERPRKTKIGTEVAHVTRDLDTTFKVKRSSNGVCINTPQKLGCAWGPPTCGRGVADPLEIYAPPHICYPAEFGRSRSNGTSLIKEIRLKKMTARVPPFKVTQGHRNWHRSIRHLWLPIKVPYQQRAYLVPCPR